MTREEALKIWLPVISMGVDTMVECKEALNMAIKALEQEPCEDAVSRQAVLDAVDRYIYKSQSTGTQDDFYSFAELVVKALPPVTPKQRTGKWLYHTIGFHKCSCCESLWSTDITRNVFCYYCPRCGAKMEGESE